MYRFNQVSQFIPCNQQELPQDSSYIFITDNYNQLYLIDNHIPILKNISLDSAQNLILIGHIQNIACFCLNITHINNASQQLHELPIRELGNHLTLEFFQAALLANHMNHWIITHQYCGVCGNKTKLSTHEWAMQCTSCNHISYTSIAPCVIGIIYHNNQILLAKNKNAKSNIYSCVAGFVNPGENLEAAFAREVMEETGLKIKDIKYIASQQWPFPKSLMMGFVAKYDSGEISIDYNELADARWFTQAELTTINLPIDVSIARYLINLAITEYITCN